MHNYLSNAPLEEALGVFLNSLGEAGFRYGTETIPTRDACGRVTAAPVYAVISSPHYNASAMDGIAVLSADTAGASEHDPVILTPDKYTVVDTGDMLPEGRDSVIMIEDIIDVADGAYKILSAARPWQNVRRVGEDICMGDMIAPRGTTVTPAICGALLAGGVTKIEVIRKPVFTVIPTGDEIIPPTDDPPDGAIIEFNSSVLRAYLKDFGAEAAVTDIIPDKKPLLSAALDSALRDSDGVIMLAGSSAGRDDYTSEIIADAGEVLIHGIAVRPGKPAVLGVAQGKPVVGLPGYPVSAIVITEEIIRPLVDLYYQRAPKKRETAKAVLGRKLVSSLKYREYVRVSLGNTDDRLVAVPLPRGAGVITSFTKAQGILEIPQDCEGLEAGETVEVTLLKSRDEINKSLVITGSHDPIIDIIADLMKKQGHDINVVSSHVGSMGAISAIKSGTAHMGAVHLMDTGTGEYNRSYIAKYFPDGGAVLVKGVGRIQGLIVAKGNPLGIRSFADAAKHRYINRQRGAGTRILCDYLIKENGLSPSDISGYDNEEYTHTAVAAQIKHGNADSGLGIYSAAKMYGLDFIPIKNEEYDFLVCEKYTDSPAVQAFFETLHSDEFRTVINDLGGYELWN